MKPSHLYRFALAALGGGLVFQASASCVDQMGSTFATTMLPVLSSALQTAITNGTQCDTTTTSGTSTISPPADSPFTAVGDAIQGVRSGLNLPRGTSSETSTSGSGQ